MKPEEPEEPYNGDPIAENILKKFLNETYCDFSLLPMPSFTNLLMENFNSAAEQIAEKLDEMQAEDFVFLCQCGIAPDLSLD